MGFTALASIPGLLLPSAPATATAAPSPHPPKPDRPTETAIETATRRYEGDPMPRKTERKRDAARPASNRVFHKISGRRLRAYSIVKHVGPRSGREYVNPAIAYPLGDGFVIPIL